MDSEVGDVSQLAAQALTCCNLKYNRSDCLKGVHIIVERVE